MEEKFLHAEEPEAERNSQFPAKSDLNSSSAGKTIAQFDIKQVEGKNRFTVQEKLKSKKIIDQLFKEGKSVKANGFTLVYLPLSLRTFFPAQVGFSVPKKHFKRAVDRNRIKRLMREAYRVQKISLYKTLLARQQQWVVMLVYKGKELPTLASTSKALATCIQRISKL